MASKIMILLCLCWSQVFAADNPSAEKVAQIQLEAKQGDADSQAQLADIYRYGKGVKIDYKESFQWASKAAEQGHAQAQHYLGICYTYGMGVEKDPTAAFKWFQQSAEQGYTAAEYRLGMCYFDGDGAPQSLEKAILFLEKAANKRDVEAMLHLSRCYLRKFRLEKEEYESTRFTDRFASDWQYKSSQIDAYMWCNLAAAAGCERAKRGIKILTEDMAFTEIKIAQERSSEWKPKP